jgi:16S rRNA (uracil1498-N3)-methyltransferase
MRRFLVPSLTVIDGSTTLDGDLFRHIVTVLRLKAGDDILLADGAGREYRGRIQQIAGTHVSIAVEEAAPSEDSAEGPRITLYQGLPKGDKMELILQKATELGVHRVVTFPAERSIAKLDRERGQSRLLRWQKIAQEAARQSNRSSVPEIALAGEFSEVLGEPADDLRLLLWEGETVRHLREVLSRPAVPATISFIVGPEGGLSEKEVRTAETHGYTAVSLGKRILRTETAGLAMLAILQYSWGDLG